MSATNFYLKNPKAEEKTLIYLFHSRNGQRYKFSTGEKIHPKYWNADASEYQHVRKSFDGYSDFNSFFQGLAEGVNEIFRNATTKSITPTPDYIREQLKKRMNKNTDVQKNFFDCLDEFIEVNTATKKPNTIKKFITLRNHLKDFQLKRKFKLSFEAIDMKFHENLLAYYIKDKTDKEGNKSPLLNSSIAKCVTHLKTFLHWATDRGYNTNTTFLKFKIFNTDADIIYLTEKELMSLSELDLDNNKRLDQVRDVFCFGCFTGLRYSDLFELKKSNVKGEELHITTVKTNDKLIIPLNDYAKAILKKHDYRLPVVSNQKMNDYLKDLGKVAEIDDEITLTKKRGAEDLEFIEPKYNFISTHTARRTFVTLSLEKGMRPEVVMSITGHKDWKTFKKYIKLIPKVKLVEMKRVWNKEPLLKVG